MVLKISFLIGGSLPQRKFKEFLSAIKQDIKVSKIDDILPNQPLIIMGSLKDGDIITIETYCQSNRLNYLYKIEPTIDLNASMGYWVPSMNTSINLPVNDDNGLFNIDLDPFISISDIKPFIELLYSIIRDSKEAALLQHFEYKNLLESVDFNKSLRQMIDNLLPQIPTIPPFILV